MAESTEDRWHGIVNEFHDIKTKVDEAAWRRADLALEWVSAVRQRMGLCWPHWWKELSAQVGLAPKTLMEWALTAYVFPVGRRKFPDEYLTFEHHRICVVAFAGMVADVDGWLQKAADANWSTAQLRRAIAAEIGKPKPGKCIHASPAIHCDWQVKSVEAQECGRCGYREVPK